MRTFLSKSESYLKIEFYHQATSYLSHRIMLLLPYKFAVMELKVQK